MASSFWKRTYTCGELRKEHVGREVVLNGWVHNWRNFGGVLFIVLRDRYGTTQLVFNPQPDGTLHEQGEKLRHEYVVAVTGTVNARPDSQINPKMPTGEIEVVVTGLQVINAADTPPIQIHNPEWEESEETRLRFRYLDLRTPCMQENILFRHRLVAQARRYLWGQGFVEVDTPVLMKSTPEGARDFLVPSRLNRGRFYALPQSPQTYKQLLMVAGYDRYFQIARCFRDEDLRADRQPEFAQIDAELSFIDEEDIYATFEGMVQALFAACLEREVHTPFRRMSYEEAFHTYGTDKPDLRFELPLHDVTATFAASEFKVFRSVAESGGHIAALRAPSAAEPFTRKTIDALTKTVGTFGAKGLVWLRVTGDGIESPTAKFFSPEETQKLLAALGAAPGDMVFMVAAPESVCFTSMGQLRLEVARLLGLIRADAYELAWVHDFPMFEFSEEEQRYVSVHHPFTAPRTEDLHLLDTDEYHRARARSYDLVLNGAEVGGGSIRIHSPQLQRRVFELLGIGEEEAERKFGFLTKAFTYGAPPHGGIAFGLDRLGMVMKGLASIRDIIPFPKTTTGLSLMDGAPDRVSRRQLDELGIQLAGDVTPEKS